MEFLADPNQCSTVVEHRRRGTSEQQTPRNQTLCKSRCCGCITPTSLRCMGICFTGTVMLLVGTVMIALFFSSSQTNTYLIPALVLFILGIIFITVAEWFCRVKVYHRYGQNHQRTLERLSGIERRLNSRPGSMPEIGDEPPSYHNSPFVQRSIPEVVVPINSSTEGTPETDTLPRPPPVENSGEDAPSYSATISDEVLPSYHEATSSEFGLAAVKDEDEIRDDTITRENP